MLARLVGGIVVGTAKLAIKYVLIPVAVTAATAILLEKLAERVRGDEVMENGIAQA